MVERIDLSLKTWLGLLFGYRKALQSATKTFSEHRKPTRDRTLLHQCRVATLASAANKTALNSLFSIRLGMYVSSRLEARDGDRGRFLSTSEYLGRQA